MKKLFLIMSIALLGLGGCGDKHSRPLVIDNALTAEEIAAGIITPEVMWKMGRVGLAGLSPDASRLLYTVTWYNLKENRGVTAIYVRDAASGEVRQLTDFKSNNHSPQWSADGRRIYFLSDRSGSSQVWEMTIDGGNTRQIKGEGISEVEGFGVSPDEKHLWLVQAVHVADRRSSDRHADMDKSKARVYDDLMCRHWDCWDEGEYRHIFVADLNNGFLANSRDIIGEEAAWDAPLAPYFNMSEISWNPAGTQLAYTCKPLTGTSYALSTDSDIFVYDLASGTTRNICKPAIRLKMGESGVEATQLTMPGYDKYPVFSPDGTKIAFCSQRRPGNESDKSRLFVWDSATGKMQDLTADFDYNASNLIWDGNEALYFIAPIHATHQLCRVNMEGKVAVLTEGDHDINAVSIANDKAVADICTIASPSELYQIKLGSGELTQLTFINQPILEHLKLGRVEKRWVETTDGKEMLTWVILPPDFDPNKKYPALLYCQGGPQNVVSQFWSYRWNFQLMAAQGYVVVAPNRRGLPSFGQEWLDQISGDYSGQNIRDYLAAIDDVAAEPWVDEERLGCVGASYGGYSVYFLAGHHDGRFKALISHCGIFDFDSMYGSTEELFFLNNDYGGAYWEKDNATAMRTFANSPHRFVDRWNTPILIITGELDFRIPYTQSLEAFTAARLHGIDARLVEFEDEDHQVMKPQNSIVWNREFFDWLNKYLKK
ncbi:MAG: S9 family peptidase [Alistipes sp.]|nr:S9 family peptidase [Alistipes sp.]